MLTQRHSPFHTQVTPAPLRPPPGMERVDPMAHVPQISAKVMARLNGNRVNGTNYTRYAPRAFPRPAR